VGLDDELEALRSALPGCRVVAFVDLQARLVLLSKADKKPRQEWLDALATTGAQMLPLRRGPVTAASTGDALPDQAVVLRQHGLSVYVRLGSDPSEALCCDCDAGADATAVLAQARDALIRIAAAE